MKALNFLVFLRVLRDANVLVPAGKDLGADVGAVIPAATALLRGNAICKKAVAREVEAGPLKYVNGQEWLTPPHVPLKYAGSESLKVGKREFQPYV